MYDKPKMCILQQAIKKTDEILTVDSLENHVHVDCHYDYLSNQHLNSSYSLNELIEALKEIE